MKFFLQNDVCFESDVILPTVTYGGVLSGGCHVSRENTLYYYELVHHLN